MPDGTAARIALDISQLDHLTVANGQFRYVMDLALGLAALPADRPFELIGSRALPDACIAGLFAPGPHAWRYRQFPRRLARGAWAFDQLRYAARLRVGRPALLHATHTFVPAAAPCPVIVTVYDLMQEIFPEYAAIAASKAYRRYRDGVVQHAAQVICISEATARDIEHRWGVPRSRLTVIPLSTNFGSAAAAPPPVPEDGRALIVAPYNLEPRKNLDALLRAVAQLDGRARIQLVLFGSAAVTPEREAAFDASVAALGLGQVVRRTGPLNDGQLAGLYDRATVFVFPSRYEGFGLPVLEAMSRGACVIARGASAMAEVVGAAGLLVPGDEPAAYTAALRVALDDAPRRQALGQAARQRAASYSIPRMAQGTLDVYRSVLGRQ